MATTVLTQDGEEWIVDKLDIATRADYLSWGTGAGVSDKGDATLFTESGDESRVQGATTQPVADKLRVVGTMTCASSGKTITNAGLFNASADGILVVKGDFDGIVLAVGDKIEFTVDLEIT